MNKENKTIQETVEYSIFSNVEYNRKNGVNKKKLKELIESIKENNYLHLHPIVVDSDFVVIDGQHRLKAAEKLNIPIFFVQQHGISSKHVMNANIAQSSWNIEDVINFYAVKEKKESYIELNSLMLELSLKPKGLISLFFGVCNNAMIALIKGGKFSFPKHFSQKNEIISCYKRLIEFVENRRISPRSMFSNAYFTQAFRLMIINETFDKDLFFKKLENKWYELRPQINTMEWFNSLISIYNWHNKSASIEKIDVR